MARSSNLRIPSSLVVRQGRGQLEVSPCAVLRFWDRIDDRFGCPWIGGKEFCRDHFPDARLPVRHLWKWVLLDQFEHTGGVRSCWRCGGNPIWRGRRLSVSAACKEGSSRRRARARDSSCEIGAGWGAMIVGRFARSYEDELVLPGLSGRDVRPALESEALGFDQQVGLVGEHSFQQVAALGVCRGRRLARGKKDPCTRDRFTLPIVDEPLQFALLLESKRRKGRPLARGLEPVGGDQRAAFRADDRSGMTSRSKAARASGTSHRPECGPARNRSESETGWPPMYGRIRRASDTCSRPRPRSGRHGPADRSRVDRTGQACGPPEFQGDPIVGRTIVEREIMGGDARCGHPQR